MKKRYKLASIGLLSTCLFFTGCGEKETVSPKPVSPSPSVQPAPVAQNPTITPVDPFAKFSKVKVVSQTYKGTYPAGIKVNIKYPEVTGLDDTTIQNKINALLKEHGVPSKFDGETDVTNDFEVKYQKGAILNIMLTGYVYPHGAAHGMPGRESLIINLENGNTYTMKDLFNQNTEYLSDLTRIVKGDDISHTLDSFNPYPGVKTDDSIYLTDGGFMIYYFPYEYASYADGFPEYRVSYKDIESYLNKNGEFWKSLPSQGTDDAQEDQDYQNYLDAKSYISSKGYRTMGNGVTPDAVVPDGFGKKLYVYNAYNVSSDSLSSLDFIFDGDKYLGTDTTNPHVSSEVKATGTGKFTITYDFVNNQKESKFDIIYSWDGKKITPDKDYNKLLP